MIPDVAIEAAARILHQTSLNRFIEPYGQSLDACKAEVRPILEAAAPLILAATVTETRVNHDHIQEGGDGYSAGFHYALTAISGGEA